MSLDSLNDELRIQLEELKKINDQPQNCIRERFYELVKEVWLSFVQIDQLVSDIHLKQILLTRYFEMIEEIKLFEQKCLYELIHNRDDRVVQQEAIDLIEIKLNNLHLMSEQSANELAREISQYKYSIEKNIFLNRTMIYLKKVSFNFDKEKAFQETTNTNESLKKDRSNRNSFESNNMNQTLIGKIVYILNEYFNKKEIQLLKK